MGTRLFRNPALLALLFPLHLLAGTLPPPGGPYPSTVNAEQVVGTPSPGQLRFPPPDLVAPAPPPPSLSEELGPGFRESAVAGQPAPVLSDGVPPARPSGHPTARQDPASPGYRYPASPAAPEQQQAQWPPAYSSSPYPAAGTAPGAWPGYPAPGGGYPAYGWQGYPYGYAAPGYSHPKPGYGTGWSESMPTPFGNMPNPWGSMPDSFFPGR